MCPEDSLQRVYYLAKLRLVQSTGKSFLVAFNMSDPGPTLKLFPSPEVTVIHITGHARNSSKVGLEFLDGIFAWWFSVSLQSGCLL